MRDQATVAGDPNQQDAGNALLYGGEQLVMERSGVLPWVMLTLLVLALGLWNAFKNSWIGQANSAVHFLQGCHSRVNFVVSLVIFFFWPSDCIGEQCIRKIMNGWCQIFSESGCNLYIDLIWCAGLICSENISYVGQTAPVCNGKFMRKILIMHFLKKRYAHYINCAKWIVNIIELK